MDRARPCTISHRASRALFWALGVATVATVLAPAAGVDAQRRRRRDREVEAVEAPPPADTEGAIMFTGDYPGAEVLVDEAAVGTLPLDPVRIAPGSHTIRIRYPGYSEYTDVVTVEAGDITDIWVDMIALSEVLAVETNPAGAHVFVDGTFLGDTPTDVELIDGERTIRLVLPGFEEVSRTVTAVAGTHETLSVDLTAIVDDGEQWYESPITWGAVGGGVAAVVLVIVIVAVATSSSGSQEDAFCAGGVQPCIRLAVTF